MADDFAAHLNGGEDEDEAMRIAIAMSLGEDPTQRHSPGPAVVAAIDLTADDDDDEVAAPAAVPPKPRAPPKSTAPQPEVAPAPGTASSLSALLGLDRKKMEEERLARLKKRKAAELGDPAVDEATTSRPQQRPRIDQTREPSSAAAAKPVTSVPGHLVIQEWASEFERLSKGRAPEVKPQKRAASAAATTSMSDLPFPKGVVKKTWARGYPRTGDDIKIEEVLQKDKLELAVLSSYQWDDEWLMSKIDLTRSKLILVAFAADEAQKDQMEVNVPIRIRFCFPPMHGPGAMHSKLQLLKYSDYLRIVVPTGNLVPYDWGETGVMENMMFIIDLPRIQDYERRASNKLTAFGEDLTYFLTAQGMDDKLVESLKNYDFSETSRYGFVHSIAGGHQEQDTWRRTGYSGLGRAVSALSLSSKDPIEVDFVCASLGAINDSLLKALYYACQGDLGLKEYESRTPGASRKGKDAASTRSTCDSTTIRDHFRVYFPSHDTVMRSKGGRNAAGTICFQPRWWHSPTFPREVLRDYQSTRKGLLMHTKMMFVRRRRSSSSPQRAAGAGAGPPEEPEGFAYLGSANLSESAWGRLVKDRGSGRLKMTCRNWECGVLIQTDSRNRNRNPAAAAAQEEATTTASSLSSGAGGSGSGKPELDSSSNWNRLFESCGVPVPMELPGTPYGEDGSARTPWFFLPTVG
ncbi:hypothetical protein QBC46DRAFT_158420 [Diplogelasinospora grovesii]|uniref:Tyrosyl-DNA phosphodiesterase 1 n=1 Tax=Diplogelasinospora grovesii TaxID=303347 RepID=A0AAN6NFT2_9PEZI|nr:hypothetical protein QBC46DRAFT_158420 [Diplogelasinospora grovesii]